MQAIVTSPSPTCGCADAVRHREDTQSSRLTQVQAETHTSADITLVTAEGDKVTVQVVKTGITPPLATSGRFWGAEMERLHHARRLHAQQ
jgi:hypothetical protein